MKGQVFTYSFILYFKRICQFVTLVFLKCRIWYLKKTHCNAKHFTFLQEMIGQWKINVVCFLNIVLDDLNMFILHFLGFDAHNIIVKKWHFFTGYLRGLTCVHNRYCSLNIILTVASKTIFRLKLYYGKYCTLLLTSVTILKCNDINIVLEFLLLKCKQLQRA